MKDQEIIDKVAPIANCFTYYPKNCDFFMFYERVLVRYTRWLERAKCSESDEWFKIGERQGWVTIS